MLATEQTVLRRFWYPVMPASTLADGPKPCRFLGEDLVRLPDIRVVAG
jgi:hypothetical protein